AVVQIEPLPQHRSEDLWIAIRRQPHDLSLVAAGTKPERTGHVLVELAKGIGKRKANERFESLAISHIHAPRVAGAVTIERDDECLGIARSVERVRGMRIVMVEAAELACPAVLRQSFRELPGTELMIGHRIADPFVQSLA